MEICNDLINASKPTQNVSNVRTMVDALPQSLNLFLIPPPILNPITSAIAPTACNAVDTPINVQSTEVPTTTTLASATSLALNSENELFRSLNSNYLFLRVIYVLFESKCIMTPFD